jgi:hypothetical protein
LVPQARTVVDQSNVSIERVIFQNILGEGEEAVGTIQDASAEEEVINDGMVCFSLKLSYSRQI